MWVSSFLQQRFNNFKLAAMSCEMQEYCPIGSPLVDVKAPVNIIGDDIHVAAESCQMWNRYFAREFLVSTISSSVIPLAAATLYLCAAVGKNIALLVIYKLVPSVLRAFDVSAFLCPIFFVLRWLRSVRLALRCVWGAYRVKADIS
jgi:hypothetical protein